MDSYSELNVSHSIEYANSNLEAAPNRGPPLLPLANQDETEPPIDSKENEPKKKPAKSKFTYRQKATITSAILAALANMMAFSIIAVFYPVEAKSKGMSQTVIGLVFTSFSISGGIGSVVWGKIIPVFGARFIFLAGAFVTGGCNILFAFLVNMPSTGAFAAFSFVIRILEGLGTSAAITASSAVVAFAFPENVGTAVSMVELMNGLAFAAGPAIGGLLYDAGGFRLPFFCLGGFVLAVDVLNFFLLPEQGSKKEESGPLTQVLRIPSVWPTLLAVVVALVGLSSLDPTLSLHLKQLDFTVIQISFLFLGLGLSYAIFSVVWGAVADAKKATRTMIAIGAFGSALFYFFLGPSPLLPFIPKTNTTVAIVCIPCFGIMLGLFVMPTFVDMFISAEWYGVANNLGLSSVVSGIWNAGFFVGGAIGPILGAGLNDAYGFGYQTTILTGCFLVIMVIIIVFSVWEFRCGKGRRVPRLRLEMEANPTEGEQKPLISSDV